MLYLQRNGIAWQIPPGRIEDRYRDGVYLPWDNWQAAESVKGYKQGNFGEYRKELQNATHVQRLRG